MKPSFGRAFPWIAAVVLAATLLATGQTTYQPKYAGDPARSEAEAAALGYMRTTLRAQKLYKKKYNHYATSLADLVGGARSFTKRMVNPKRGDYTVSFRAHKEKDTFQLAMTPEHVDAEHRSFYAEEDLVIHGDDQGAASESSPVVK